VAAGPYPAVILVRASQHRAGSDVRRIHLKPERSGWQAAELMTACKKLGLKAAHPQSTPCSPFLRALIMPNVCMAEGRYNSRQPRSCGIIRLTANGVMPMRA
jgi:hypothetical protein